MSRKIIGVTVGTPTSPSRIAEDIKPISYEYQELSLDHMATARYNINAASNDEVVKFSEDQKLTEEQKAQARANIGAVSADEIPEGGSSNITVDTFGDNKLSNATWNVTSGGTLVSDTDGVITVSHDGASGTLIGVECTGYDNGFAQVAGDVWYMGAKIAHQKHNPDYASIQLALSVSGNYRMLPVQAPLSEEATDYYSTFEIPSDLATPFTTVRVRVQYQNTQYVAGKTCTFSDFVLVNLTETYGAGNEPTADEYHALLAGAAHNLTVGTETLFLQKAQVVENSGTSSSGSVIIPSALPNPHKLTFTGAVNAEYDGSEAVEVNIPEGGSGGGGIPIPETAEIGQTIVVKAVDENGKPTEWEAADLPSGGGGGSPFNDASWGDPVAVVTATEEVYEIKVTQTDDGRNIADIGAKEMLVCFVNPKSDTSAYEQPILVYFRKDLRNWYDVSVPSASSSVLKCTTWAYAQLGGPITKQGPGVYYEVMKSTPIFGCSNVNVNETFDGLIIRASESGKVHGAGATVKIWLR